MHVIFLYRIPNLPSEWDFYPHLTDQHYAKKSLRLYIFTTLKKLISYPLFMLVI